MSHILEKAQCTLFRTWLCLRVCCQKNYRVNLPFIKKHQSVIPRKQRPRKQGKGTKLVLKRIMCCTNSALSMQSAWHANVRERFLTQEQHRPRKPCSIFSTSQCNVRALPSQDVTGMKDDKNPHSVSFTIFLNTSSYFINLS